MEGRCDVAEPVEELSEALTVFIAGRTVLGDDLQLHGRTVLKVDDEGALVLLLVLVQIHNEPDHRGPLHKLDMAPENLGAVLEEEAERR